MTHDWLSQFDDELVEKIRSAIEGQVYTNKGQPIGEMQDLVFSMPKQAGLSSMAPTFQTEFPYPGRDLIEQLVRTQRERDEEKLRDAVRRGVELEQGILVVSKDGQVVSAEPSGLVPINTCYWINQEALEGFLDNASTILGRPLNGDAID